MLKKNKTLFFLNINFTNSLGSLWIYLRQTATEKKPSRFGSPSCTA